MPTVDLTSLPKEILSSREDTVLLVGLPWRELQPQDQMVRLVLLGPKLDLTKPMETLTVFLHQITLLTSKEGERVVRHVGPEDLDTHSTRILFEDEAYTIVNRITASWNYFSETHHF